MEKGTCVFDLRIEDFIHNEHGPIDAGITSVACRSLSSPVGPEPFFGKSESGGTGAGGMMLTGQYHPMESLSLLDRSIRWSESGTSKPVNSSRDSRVTKIVSTGRSLLSPVFPVSELTI